MCGPRAGCLTACIPAALSGQRGAGGRWATAHRGDAEHCDTPPLPSPHSDPLPSPASGQCNTLLSIKHLLKDVLEALKSVHCGVAWGGVAWGGVGWGGVEWYHSVLSGCARYLGQFCGVGEAWPPDMARFPKVSATVLLEGVWSTVLLEGVWSTVLLEGVWSGVLLEGVWSGVLLEGVWSGVLLEGVWSGVLLEGCGPQCCLRGCGLECCLRGCGPQLCLCCV